MLTIIWTFIIVTSEVSDHTAYHKEWNGKVWNIAVITKMWHKVNKYYWKMAQIDMLSAKLP